MGCLPCPSGVTDLSGLGFPDWGFAVAWLFYSKCVVVAGTCVCAVPPALRITTGCDVFVKTFRFVALY